MRVVLLGPPGAGKGTQAKLLADTFSVPHFSTGDLLREAVEQKSSLGLSVKGYLDDGELVPDELMLGLVGKLVDDGGRRGFVLDGFPRTVSQADGLREILSREGTALNGVISLEAPAEVLVHRLSQRRLCSDCGADYNLSTHPPRLLDVCDRCGGKLIQRNDDRLSTIRHRLEVYRRQTEPLKKFYADRGLLINVDGTGEVEEVHRLVVQALAEVKE